MARESIRSQRRGSGTPGGCPCSWEGPRMGSTRRNIVTLAVAGVVIAGFGAFGAFSASMGSAEGVGPIDFEAPGYVVGSVNGQDGWSSGAARDQGVVQD